MFASDIGSGAPKAAGSFDRCVPLEQTLRLVPRLRERYGITRVAEITHLDRIGIPVMSAVVPDSPDAISVYNGKGTTREAALVGAVMEAVERQVAAAPALRTRLAPAAAVLAGLGLGEDPNDGRRCEVADGIDAFTGAAVDVPLAMVQCPWPGEPVAAAASSCGLAAGNTLAEAVYHALCERVERHLWASAHAAGFLTPRAIVARFAGAPISLPDFVDDPVALDVAMPTGFPVVDGLLERIRAAGCTIRLRAVERAHFPLLMIATIVDPSGTTLSSHVGLGCSLSPEHAARRAITEAAQSRAADFLAAREDLYRHDDADVPDGGIRRAARLPLGRWYYDAPAAVARLDAFADRSTDDVARDVERIVDGLRRAGIRRVAIVDCSPNDLPIHVVRIVAPDLGGHPFPLTTTSRR